MRGRERAPIQSHGPPRPRVRAVPSVSRTKQSRYGRGRRSLPLLVTRTPPHEWVFAGPPSDAHGDQPRRGGTGQEPAPGSTQSTPGRRGELGSSGDRPPPAGRPGPPLGPTRRRSRRGAPGATRGRDKAQAHGPRTPTPDPAEPRSEPPRPGQRPPPGPETLPPVAPSHLRPPPRSARSSPRRLGRLERN